jgi:arabinose-5-phosphate isomerase
MEGKSRFWLIGVRQMRGHIAALQSAMLSAPRGFDRAVCTILGLKGKVFVTGVGTSGCIARRFAHLLCCCGVSGVFVETSALINGSAGCLSKADLLFIITKSAKGNGLEDLSNVARAIGCKIAIQSGIRPAWARASDVILEVDYSQSKDLLGQIATTSSLINAAICDCICATVLQEKGQTDEKLLSIHPEGGVGATLRLKKGN